MLAKAGNDTTTTVGGSPVLAPQHRGACLALPIFVCRPSSLARRSRTGSSRQALLGLAGFVLFPASPPRSWLLDGPMPLDRPRRPGRARNVAPQRPIR